MDGSLAVTSSGKKERAPVGWPWPINKMSFQWVCTLSLCACFQFTIIPLESCLLPELKLLTPSQAANARVLQKAMLWFSAAGAGSLILLASLPLLRAHGRIRQALACVGLAAAAAKHCVITWLMGATLVAAPSEDLLCLSVGWALVFVYFAVVDVNASLVLLRPPGEEE